MLLLEPIAIKRLLKLTNEKDSLLEAAGISVKARAHLLEEDKSRLLQDFIDKALEPCGQHYIDEVIYRYLLTLGDALGGRMRNIVGSIANEKLTRFIISQLQISNFKFSYYRSKQNHMIDGKNYDIDDAEKIKLILWKSNKHTRSLIYNVNVPPVGKNIDIVLLNTTLNLDTTQTKLILSNKESYLAIGELKGGIDPAGADEHWKTANTALARVRTAFNGKVHLFFVGAAIETSMSNEIFSQYNKKELENCANLTNDNQLAALCEWLVRQ